MNNGKYKPIIEQFKKAKTAKEQRDCLFTMLCMIATNHLGDIELEQKNLKAWVSKRFKYLWIAVGVIFLSIILTNPPLAEKVIELISKVI